MAVGAENEPKQGFEEPSLLSAIAGAMVSSVPCAPFPPVVLLEAFDLLLHPLLFFFLSPVVNAVCAMYAVYAVDGIER